MKASNYLLEICKKHGITLVELGKRVGKSKQYMSELGRGNIPLKYDMAIKIANALSATPDELFLDILSSEDSLQSTGTQD